MNPKALHANCDACPLKDMDFVPPDPIKPGAKYTIIGESPGRDEILNAKKGMPEPGFTGISGKLLWDVMRQVGVERKDVNINNAVLCAPPAGDEDKQEILLAASACCHKRLMYDLQQRTKTSILALGRTARETLMGPPKPNENQDTLVGRWFHHDGLDVDVLSTYHPAYILREPDNAKTMFDDMIKYIRKGPVHIEAPSYTVVTPDTLRGVLDELSEPGKVLSYDIETDQLDYRNDAILMLVATNRVDHAYIFPAAHPQSPYNLLFDTALDDCWSKFWSCKDITFAGHNAKFDMRFLRWTLNWRPRVDFDTMIAHFVLDERKGVHDLKALAARYLDIPDYEAEQLHRFLKSKKDRYSKIPWPNLCQYGAWDVCNTLRLVDVFTALLKRENAYDWPFKNTLMPLVDVIHDAEMRGITVDVDYAMEVSEKFDDESRAVASEIMGESDGIVTNPNSSHEISALLYQKLKLPMPRGRKIKPGSTGKEALLHLRNAHPIVPKIMRYRRIAKMKSSYIDNILNVLDDEGAAHPEFYIHGTETRRLSVRNPAAQTIPRADDREDGQFGTIVKNMFIPRPGFLFVAVDYSQAELRVGAAESGEPFLIQVYEDDRDLHTEVAIAMFGPNYGKADRHLTKMFNFAYLYGGTEHSLAQDAAMPIEIARKFVKDYDGLMPRLKVWKDEQVQLMKRRGFVPYRMGGRRRIPFVCNVNENDARKSAINSPVQGQASELTSYSAITIAPYLKSVGAYLLLLVHDSLLIEAPIAVAEQVAHETVRVMVEVGTKFFPEVKWKAEAEIGPRWGTMKSI